MIQTLTYMEAESASPYHNLALEEYLMFHCQENECILYLWQNQRTVVIGCNQNAWQECRVGELEADGGYLARRPSGGGAVYHDLGNLNFTFLVRRPHYDVTRQLAVIVQALQALGIAAEQSGRNDILAGGRKFSGNAFYQRGDYCCHHGTIMVAVDQPALTKYLTVPATKLAAKGIASVRARVVNLVELQPELTVAHLKAALREAFAKVYGGKVRRLAECTLPAAEIAWRTRHFAAREWRLGRTFAFQAEHSQRFSWGEVTLQFAIEAGRVRETAVYSDALEPGVTGPLAACLQGCPYDQAALAAALQDLVLTAPKHRARYQEIQAWLAGAAW